MRKISGYSNVAPRERELDIQQNRRNDQQKACKFTQELSLHILRLSLLSLNGKFMLSGQNT
jgi:hypothetical protein